MLKRIKYLLKSIFIVLFQLSLIAVIVYRVVPIAYTPLMGLRFLQKNQEQTEFQKEWIPIQEMGLQVPLSAVTGEDPKFFNHFGFDFKQIANAAQNNLEGGKIHGASTISQQTAKNIFLLPTRSYIRKALEVYFTGMIELIWNKKRILEVYLNIIETGPRIFGVQAASKHYFKKNVANLNTIESARLISVLPNPLRWHPDNLNYDYWDKKIKPNHVLKNHFNAIVYQRRYVPTEQFYWLK